MKACGQTASVFDIEDLSGEKLNKRLGLSIPGEQPVPGGAVPGKQPPSSVTNIVDP